jgi:hypothetical protein
MLAQAPVGGWIVGNDIAFLKKRAHYSTVTVWNACEQFTPAANAMPYGTDGETLPARNISRLE